MRSLDYFICADNSQEWCVDGGCSIDTMVHVIEERNKLSGELQVYYGMTRKECSAVGLRCCKCKLCELKRNTLT